MKSLSGTAASVSSASTLPKQTKKEYLTVAHLKERLEMNMKSLIYGHSQMHGGAKGNIAPPEI